MKHRSSTEPDFVLVAIIVCLITISFACGSLASLAWARPYIDEIGSSEGDCRRYLLIDDNGSHYLTVCSNGVVENESDNHLAR